MSKSNIKSNSKTKTFHEEESQNLSRVHVSLDNADTVIEGGPAFELQEPLRLWVPRPCAFCKGGNHERRQRVFCRRAAL
jgi:hypothetical protein